MQKNKLYYFLLVACFLGFCWLFFSISYIEKSQFSTCFIKNTTSIPCPSCGTTRAIIHLVNGNLKVSVLTNPFGIIVFSIMLIVPIWIVFDLALKNNSFYRFYIKLEQFVGKKPIAILLIVVVICNWYWNIKKGL